MSPEDMKTLSGLTEKQSMSNSTSGSQHPDCEYAITDDNESDITYFQDTDEEPDEELDPSFPSVTNGMDQRDYLIDAIIDMSKQANQTVDKITNTEALAASRGADTSNVCSKHETKDLHEKLDTDRTKFESCREDELRDYVDQLRQILGSLDRDLRTVESLLHKSMVLDSSP